MIEKRFQELAQRSWSRGIPLFTDFLDLNEQTALQRMQRSLPQPEICRFGGAEGCERVMAGFGVAESAFSLFPIACLRITPNGMKFTDGLAHRDVLGSLMSLGFERSLLGDIVLREKEAYVFCTDRIADFICGSLVSVRRSSVKVSRVEAPPAGELFRLQREIIQVASARLDALVAHCFRISRGAAQSLFPAEKVFLDGAVCLRPDAEPSEGQIVSARGYGRFRYLGPQSQSKKGKWNIAIDQYV